MKTILKNKPDFRETAFVLGVAFLWNEAVYLGARQIAHSWHHFDMTTPLDSLTPFLPWTIIVYWGCYIFWCVNYFICATQARTERDRFFCADLIAKGICFLLFILCPTTNIRPEITGNSIWDSLMRLLYRIDAADNLFPSIHCLVSWLCWIGVRKRKNIPILYRYFSLMMACAVCISTLTTNQHVLVDVIGSILLAELCFYLSGYTGLRRYYTAAIARLIGLYKPRRLLSR